MAVFALRIFMVLIGMSLLQATIDSFQIAAAAVVLYFAFKLLLAVFMLPPAACAVAIILFATLADTRNFAR